MKWLDIVEPSEEKRMAIDSLDIGVKMCDRVVRLVEAGKSVEEIEDYCSTQKAYYETLLKGGVGRSEADWAMEDVQFDDMLEEPKDKPAISKMKATPEPPAEPAPVPGVVRGMMSSTDLRE